MISGTAAHSAQKMIAAERFLPTRRDTNGVGSRAAGNCDFIHAQAGSGRDPLEQIFGCGFLEQ
ncbi:MAG: hypothetical protein WCC45_11545 [Paeniglutamicibacter sp.]|uniref:hypothetical protein n=1 Tax=Arthrobacter sp. UCD-GKA TaxID=1913576 RepID=UPI00111347C9|nr:hypothetical protein [Arthrobacter sp. UCD-GKA]